ncbi:hypothetical protein EIP86_011571 [Pleurotus ostreatoroseus]|nr:hypothetical protein EIP86_011571 [Pleurotus ostreatoroseus]
MRSSSFAPPRTFRSTETPMDFEFTDRPNVKPAWSSDHEMGSPRKRTLSEMNTPSPNSLRAQPTVSFGRIQDVPFMLNIPSPQTPVPTHWVPPPGPVMARLFPQPEVHDVDMAEPSPPRPPPSERALEKEMDEDEGEKRLIATGGLRRVFKARQKKMKSERYGRSRVETEDEEEADLESDELRAHVTKATNYTLNVAHGSGLHADKPYILLGYLQVFWQFSLVAVALYIILLCVITLHRDVETRVSEYSMRTVEAIRKCAKGFADNKCAEGPMPALVDQCGAWATCMQRDPTRIGRATVTAELLAEIVNSFMETITWKTLLATLTSLSFLGYFLTSLLSLHRSRHHSNNAPPHPPSAMPPYPLPDSHFRPENWGKGVPAIESEQPSRRRKLINGTAKEVE